VRSDRGKGERRGLDPRRRLLSVLSASLLLLPVHPVQLVGQAPADLDRERREFASWLETAPLSPFAILALHPVGQGISIGSEPADIPLAISARGIAREEGNRVVLDRGDQRLTLPRGRAVEVGGYRLVAGGPPGRAVVAAFGAVRRYRAPTYYRHAPAWVVTATLEPPERRGVFRTLGPDGVETEATEIGFARFRLSEERVRLRVYRVGGLEDEEAPLLAFFRDGTNGRGTYPAGRFVELVPLGDGRYQLDFNRASNPYCAYSTVFPCPAPWAGNAIRTSIPAGERYQP
jgi:hypothetical protein